ncbi:MAG: Ger(x)C family spore germination protein [Halanaerobiales bacterium]|nr:Ger(x)C family spore germination protein [Halanaerobiales bacterium]
MSLQSDVVIAKGMTAKKVLEAGSDLDSLPVMHLVDILKNYVALAKMSKILLFDLLKQMGSQGRSPVIGVVSQRDHDKDNFLIKDLLVEGGAIIKKDKLAGWLDCMETRGLLFVLGEVKSTIINVANPLDKDKKVAIEVTQSNAKMDAQLKNEKLIFSIEINEEGNIGSQQGVGDLTIEEMIKILEEETKIVIEKEVRHVIELAKKKYNADIFGFGEIVHRKYPNYWKEVKEDWNAVFSETPVEIKVESSIRRSGMIKKPTTPY